MSNKYNYGNCLYYDNLPYLIDPGTFHGSGDNKKSEKNGYQSSGCLGEVAYCPPPSPLLLKQCRRIIITNKNMHHFAFLPATQLTPLSPFQKVHEHIRSAHQIIRGAALRHQSKQTRPRDFVPNRAWSKTKHRRTACGMLHLRQ